MTALYGYWRSSCTYRVRIALALKGVEHTIVPVHLLEGGGQQHADGYRAKNPMAQVPSLEIEGGVTLGQSMAILEYLEERYREPPLLPEDLILRARARQLAEIVNSGIQPLQNLAVMKRLKAAGVEPNEWSVDHIRRGLAAYAAVCEPVAGAFSVGDAPTLADCALVPQLYNARRFAIDVAADFPLLARIDARCAELEAFARAHPDRQPDAQSEAR